MAFDIASMGTLGPVCIAGLLAAILAASLYLLYVRGKLRCLRLGRFIPRHIMARLRSIRKIRRRAEDQADQAKRERIQAERQAEDETKKRRQAEDRIREERLSRSMAEASLKERQKGKGKSQG